ncbi:MAG TPA: hypothetical protein VGK71_10320, partial [Nitrospirota bacterium]
KYLPDAVRERPDGLLRELNPDYLAARKRYTKEAFQEIIAKYPGTAYAAAAGSELASLGEYDRDQAKLRAEREKRNAEAEAESKRQGAILERATQAKESSGLEPLGKLINNSSDTVLFVFKEPADVPQTTVSPNSFASVRLSVGTFSFDVFKVGAAAVQGFQDEKRQPVKSGDVTVIGNFWEAVYP